MKIIFCIQFALICLLIHSQDVKKIVNKKKYSRTVEEFFVIKSDKSIKNGSYLKYMHGPGNQKSIEEFGNYYQGKRNGTWFIFNYGDPLNPISIIGEYADGQRTGRWVYFYPLESKSFNLFDFVGFNKRNEIISSKREIKILLDTTGLKIAAVGYFDDNRKVGRWNYYSNKGEVIKIYDFSTNKNIYSANNDSISFFQLGGLSSFYNEFNQAFLENIYEFNSIPNSDVTFEIITHEGNLFINNLTPIGDNPFSPYYEKIIKDMPLYWTEVDPIFESFSFIVKMHFVGQPNAFTFVYSPNFLKKN